MRRSLAVILAAAGVTFAACGGSGTTGSGTTTTTDATAYATAYTVCLQARNTDAARNAEPQKLTDDAADDVFLGLALQLRPASKKDPAWRKLQATADLLRRQLTVTTASVTDDQIEETISKLIDQCKPASAAPKGPSVQMTPSSSTPSSTTTPVSTSAPA